MSSFQNVSTTHNLGINWFAKEWITVTLHLIQGWKVFFLIFKHTIAEEKMRQNKYSLLEQFFFPNQSFTILSLLKATVGSVLWVTFQKQVWSAFILKHLRHSKGENEWFKHLQCREHTFCSLVSLRFKKRSKKQA